MEPAVLALSVAVFLPTVPVLGALPVGNSMTVSIPAWDPHSNGSRGFRGARVYSGRRRSARCGG